MKFVTERYGKDSSLDLGSYAVLYSHRSIQIPEVFNLKTSAPGMDHVGCLAVYFLLQWFPLKRVKRKFPRTDTLLYASNRCIYLLKHFKFVTKLHPRYSHGGQNSLLHLYTPKETQFQFYRPQHFLLFCKKRLLMYTNMYIQQ